MELLAEITDTPASAEPGRGDIAPAVPPVAKPAFAGEPIPDHLILSSSDDALVRASLGGQKEAFGELVRRYTKMVYWYVSGRVRDSAEIEDIAQEAVLRAYEDLPRLRVPRAYPSWLISIAGAVLRSRARAKKHHATIDADIEALGSPAEVTPLDKLSRDEMRSRLRDEMAVLPEHYRSVLALKYMNGYSVEEIARRIEVPEGTVRARLCRAYAMLRRRLKSSAQGDRSDD